MTRQDKASYHSQRATSELDLGLTAASPSAARAHLQLASMHMQRLRELAPEAASPLLPILG